MTSAPSPQASFLDLPARTLLETLSQLEQAVMVVDRRGRVVWISDSLGLFCDSPALVIGRSTHELLVDPSRLQDFAREFLTHGRIAPCILEIRRGRGTRHVEFSAVLLPGEQPEPLFW